MTTSTRPTAIGEYRPAQGAPDSPLGQIWVDAVRRIWTIVIGGMVTGVAFVLLAFLIAPQYTATTTFMPDPGQGMNGGLTGLVGQLTGMPSGGMTPRLAADLATSDALLKEALYQRFQSSGPSGSRRDSVRLIDYVAKPNFLGRILFSHPDSAAREEGALRELRGNVAADVNERTGLVDLLVTLDDPVISAGVANRLLDLVDDFNATTTQTRARTTRRFLEGRVESAREEVGQQEARLQAFYRENRAFNQSPELLVTETRLRSDLEIKRSVLTSITQQLEQARIDEVRDTPVITRVKPATPPIKPSFPKKSIFGILGLILGALVTFGWGALQSFGVWHAQFDPAAHAQLLDALSHAHLRGRIGKARAKART